MKSGKPTPCRQRTCCVSRALRSKASRQFLKAWKNFREPKPPTRDASSTSQFSMNWIKKDFLKLCTEIDRAGAPSRRHSRERVYIMQKKRLLHVCFNFLLF